jgi:sensor domain CHASE-containing protein
MIAPHGIARYIYPIYDARKLSGYDVINDPDQATREVIQRAILTREITLSQPTELLQGGFGITAWRAVYRGTVLWGLVSISVDVPTILAEIGMTNSANNMDLSLRDSTGNPFFGSAEVWQLGDGIPRSHHKLHYFV